MLICMSLFATLWLFNELTVDSHIYSKETRGGSPIVSDSPKDNSTHFKSTRVHKNQSILIVMKQDWLSPV